MDAFVMYLTVAVALADAGLAGVLLFIYAREYARMRAPFTAGLVMFALFFLGQNLLAAYGYLVLMVFLPDNVQPIMLAIMILEGLALGVMAYHAASVRAKEPAEDAEEGPAVPASRWAPGASLRLPGRKVE